MRRGPDTPPTPASRDDTLGSTRLVGAGAELLPFPETSAEAAGLLLLPALLAAGWLLVMVARLVVAAIRTVRRSRAGSASTTGRSPHPTAVRPRLSAMHTLVDPPVAGWTVI